MFCWVPSDPGLRAGCPCLGLVWGLVVPFPQLALGRWSQSWRDSRESGGASIEHVALGDAKGLPGQAGDKCYLVISSQLATADEGVMDEGQ